MKSIVDAATTTRSMGVHHRHHRRCRDDD